MFEGWEKYATTDPAKIQSWWSGWRNAENNIGIATGEGSGIWVLDVDGTEGEATLRQLEAEHGALPPTVEALSGSGDGRHLYFKWPAGTEIRNAQERAVMPSIDVCGNGGYAVAPPSVHPSGGVYAWKVDGAKVFADAPQWLIDLVTRKTFGKGAPATATTPEQWRTFVNEDVDGSRRGSAIARLYGLLIRSRAGTRYFDPIVALDIIRLFNAAHCKPPLDDGEIVRIANDIASREADRRESRHE